MNDSIISDDTKLCFKASRACSILLNRGQHGRNRGSGYAVLEWLDPARGSLSLGARDEVFDGGTAVFSPMLSVTRWLSSTTTVHASIGHGLRIPSYIDLYYCDPTTIGNPNLKPESA